MPFYSSALVELGEMNDDNQWKKRRVGSGHGGAEYKGGAS
jgi:hypothetical protein